MSSKDKILQYIEYKGITVYEFEKITGLSHGILRSGKHFGVDKMKQIRDNLPDLNMNWLIYNEGNMLLKANNNLNESDETYKKPCGNCDILEKDLKNAEKLLEAKEETIGILKHQLGIDNNGKSKAC